MTPAERQRTEPMKENATEKLTIRLTVTDLLTFQKLGGLKWLRQVLAVKREQMETPLKSQSVI